MPDQPMPLVAHLIELRRRLVIVCIAVFVGFLIAYSQAEYLFHLLLLPLKEVFAQGKGEIIFTSLTEPFIIYLKTGLLGGFLLALPVIFLQIWLFIKPAFRGKEQKYTSLFVIVASLLFLTGALFGYFVVFPLGFSFLLTMGASDYLPYLTIREYFSFAISMLFAFGLIFETPLILLFLARLGVINATWLRQKRRYAIVVASIIGAILTPPDIITQTLMMIPLILLYEISIWLIVLIGQRKKPNS